MIDLTLFMLVSFIYIKFITNTWNDVNAVFHEIELNGLGQIQKSEMQ